jgi:hypothetical protein
LARRTFDIATEPHEAEIGSHILRFIPEATGTLFVDAYARMIDGFGETDLDDDPDNLDPEELRRLLNAAIEFLIEFSNDEATNEILRGNVLPFRVMQELTKWLAALYGSGETEATAEEIDNGDVARPTGRSTASSGRSANSGTKSTRPSSSKGSTSTRSRRAASSR